MSSCDKSQKVGDFDRLIFFQKMASSSIRCQWIYCYGREKMKRTLFTPSHSVSSNVWILLNFLLRFILPSMTFLRRQFLLGIRQIRFGFLSFVGSFFLNSLQPLFILQFLRPFTLLLHLKAFCCLLSEATMLKLDSFNCFQFEDKLRLTLQKTE